MGGQTIPGPGLSLQQYGHVIVPRVSLVLSAGEPTVRYHPSFVWTLTYCRNPVEGHYQAGSLTGAVAPKL